MILSGKEQYVFYFAIKYFNNIFDNAVKMDQKIKVNFICFQNNQGV